MFVKIGDFGLSKEEIKSLKSRVGTLFYMSPELIDDETYTCKADVWYKDFVFSYFSFQTIKEELNRIMISPCYLNRHYLTFFLLEIITLKGDDALLTHT